MELCWLTTCSCNQNCNYCDRFNNIENLTREEYLKILDKLIHYGVRKITFGGGESLMVKCFSEIIEEAHINNIHLKLVTNGKLIPENEHLIKYFDEITLSIDAINNDVNRKLGRGLEHFQSVCTAIDTIKSHNDTNVNINSVVTKINLDSILQMVNQINKWEVSKWRIFRFCPLRGKALSNQMEFEISDEEFEQIQTKIKRQNLSCKVQFRNYADMEKGYLLITPKGELCVSRNMKDIVVGDMMNDDLRTWFNEK